MACFFYAQNPNNSTKRLKISGGQLDVGLRMETVESNGIGQVDLNNASDILLQTNPPNLLYGRVSDLTVSNWW